MNEHELLTHTIVRLAIDAGASAAEATVSSGDEFEAQVRLGQVEILKEAGARGAGIRLFLGQRAGSAYTSDLTDAGLRRMVHSALDLARISTEDPCAGLPEPAALGAITADLQLYSPTVAALETTTRIELARAAEAAALAVDPRIDNSEGATFSAHTGWRAFSNSHGFTGSYQSSSCSLSVVPVVREDGKLERDYWFTNSRRADQLEDPVEVGRKAAARVLRRLGARKVPTQKVPVVFEQRAARSLVGHVFSAVAGESIYHNSSFLAGHLGKPVAASCVTILDDATLPGLFGSSPFDDEGVPCRRTTVINAGVLESYLLNTYAARKLGLASTGNASRGLTGNPSTGCGNLFLQPGPRSPEGLIGSVKCGLLVTELLGSGVNIVNGDYSRGAAGLWIENGRLAYPVHEITISGNIRRILESVEEVASDLEFRGSIASPTVLIGEMMVSGS